MRVICDRAALQEAVNLVSGVVPARTPRPQLGCVKLAATKEGKAGRLTLTATDGEVSLRLTTANVDLERAGEALVPADKLKQIVAAEETEPTVTLEVEGETCTILAGRDRYVLRGYPADEFPAIEEFEKVSKGARGSFTQPAGALSQMIARTLFAAARESTRFAINGVLIARDGKKLRLVATDGRRLAMSQQTLSGQKDAGDPVSCVVPAKALGMVQRLIGTSEQPVRVAVTESQILFAIGGEGGGAIADAVLVSNLVDGTFPPYEDVIPRDQDVKITFDRDVFFGAVRRAALLTNEESRGVRMKFSGQSRHAELSSRSPETGEAQVNVDLSNYDGVDVEVAFNPSYISDALKVISDPEVVFELKSAGQGATAQKPGLIRSGSDFVYVVMPVTI